MPVTVGLADDFNRADSATLGVDWTANCFSDGADSPSVTSNAAVFSFYATAARTSASLDGAQDIEVAGLIKAMPSSATLTIGIGLAQQLGVGTVDGYLFVVNLSGTLTPIKYTDGVEADQVTSSLTFQAADIFIVRRRASDGRMQVFRDRAGVETLALTYTDLSFAGPFNLAIGGFDSAAAASFEEVYAGITSGVDGTVIATAADAVGDIPTPTVSSSSGASVIAPVADGTGDLPSPTVAADAAVVAPAADATGDIPGIFPSSSEVAAAPAVGTGDIPDPTISSPGSSGVTAVPAGGIGDIPTPGVSSDASVAAPVADATGDIPAPGVAAVAAGTVLAGPAVGAGGLPVPQVQAIANTDLSGIYVFMGAIDPGDHTGLIRLRGGALILKLNGPAEYLTDAEVRYLIMRFILSPAGGTPPVGYIGTPLMIVEPLDMVGSMGTLIGRYRIVDESGNHIGFVPVYQS